MVIPSEALTCRLLLKGGFLLIDCCTVTALDLLREDFGESGGYEIPIPRLENGDPVRVWSDVMGVCGAEVWTPEGP